MYGKNQAQEIRQIIQILNISCSCVEFVFTILFPQQWRL